MKKTAFILIFLFLLIGCKNNQNEMSLTAYIKGLRKGTVYLQKMEDTTLVTLDSVIVNGNEKMFFSEAIKSPEIYYLVLNIEDDNLLDDRITFFAEPHEITIQTNLKEFTTKAIITGSINQDKLNEFYKLIDRYSTKNLQLIEKDLLALKNKNDSLHQEISKKQKSLVRSRYLAIVNFAIQNKDYELAPFLMVNQVNNLSKKYLDTVYQALNPKIKNSKYGKALELLISKEKND